MRWRAELPYLLPVLLLHPLLYWNAYQCWFQQDDFAWLGLLQLYESGASLSRLLFEPMAQGTVRPISERGFFLLFRRLFDLNAAPYHGLVFLTQTANLVLLYALVRRHLVGSAGLAALAALLWCSNGALAWPLSWASAYNQVLISFIFLSGLSAFARYAGGGGKRWLTLAWIVFLLGFGVLETNIVFPALALAYALVWAPHTWRAAAWMFAPAAAFSAFRVLALPKQAAGGTYAMEFGAHLPVTLARYWARAMWPAETRAFTGLPVWLVAIPAVAVAALIGWRLWRRDKLAAFGVAWFLITLSVYLVLPHHVSDYYLAAPTIGLAMALASALGAAPRALAAVTLLAILPVSWFGIWKFTGLARQRSTAWENLMDGVAQIAARNPGKPIYLEGIGQDLFIQGFSDSPFRLIGVTNVKLTPHEAETIDVRGWLASIAPFTVPPGVALNAIDASGAVVYRFAGDRFENITAAYRTKLAASPRVAVAPPRIETGEAGYGYLLGPGWFEPDGGYRWIGKSAQATLGGAIAGQKLFVHGFCAPAQLAAGPLHLSVTPELAAEPATFTVDSCGGSFEFAVALPAALAGRPRFTVLLAVDRAGKIPPDTRELGLAIETMELSY